MYSLGIAKHLYIHTDEQPTSMDVRCALYIRSVRLAISTSIRHFLLFSKNFVSKDGTKIMRILIYTYIAFSFSFSLCNSNNILISQFLFSIAEK